jgi:hypothetical protein
MAPSRRAPQPDTVKMSLDAYSGGCIVLDVFNIVYQHGADHARHFAWLVPQLRARQITVIAVFDGPTPDAKRATVQRRRAARERSTREADALYELSAAVNVLADASARLGERASRAPRDGGDEAETSGGLEELTAPLLDAWSELVQLGPPADARSPRAALVARFGERISAMAGLDASATDGAARAPVTREDGVRLAALIARTTAALSPAIHARVRQARARSWRLGRAASSALRQQLFNLGCLLVQAAAEADDVCAWLLRGLAVGACITRDRGIACAERIETVHADGTADVRVAPRPPARARGGESAGDRLAVGRAETVVKAVFAEGQAAPSRARASPSRSPAELRASRRPQPAPSWDVSGSALGYGAPGRRRGRAEAAAECECDVQLLCYEIWKLDRTAA